MGVKQGRRCAPDLQVQTQAPRLHRSQHLTYTTRVATTVPIAQGADPQTASPEPTKVASARLITPAHKPAVLFVPAPCALFNNTLGPLFGNPFTKNGPVAGYAQAAYVPKRRNPKCQYFYSAPWSGLFFLPRQRTSPRERRRHHLLRLAKPPTECVSDGND